MKKIIFTITVVLITMVTVAQDTTAVEGPWKSNGMVSLNFSQIGLTNWAQGGESSYAINTLSAFNINYAQDNTSWDNSMDFGYGIQKIGEKDPGKTDDHLELMSKYGYKTSNDWYISGLLSLKTQFTKGYKVSEGGDILISDFLSPGYILLAIGMEYKPNDSFFINFSPISGKITMVLNDSLSNAGSFGLEAGKNMRSEFGGSVIIGINREIMKNVTLNSTLDLFSNYIENPQNVDINWKVLVNMKINEFLSANISTHLRYDDDIPSIDADGTPRGPKVQFKEILGVGLSYKF